MPPPLPARSRPATTSMAQAPEAATIVFVWFRVALHQRDQVEHALRALSAGIEANGAAAPEVAVRDEPGAPWQTWLEQHRLPPGNDVGAYLADLAKQATHLGLDRLAQGGRRVETFVLLPKPRT
jgi:hypothetical protein